MKLIFVAFLKKCTQREYDAQKTFYKSFIKVRKIKKNLNVFIRLWFWSINDRFDLARIYLDVFAIYDKSQKIRFNNAEFWLFYIYIQFVLQKTFEHDAHVLHKHLQDFEKNENIINICESKYVEIFSKCDVDIRLKRRQCICEMKRNNTILVHVVTRAKRSFSLVFLFDANFVIRSDDI